MLCLMLSQNSLQIRVQRTISLCLQGGLIAKRLLAYPSTLDTTALAITLAAPLEAPVVNVDAAMDDFYMLMDLEWKTYIHNHPFMKEKKVLISFGNGPRDLLMPSGLTSSNDSFISALVSIINQYLNLQKQCTLKYPHFLFVAISLT